MELDIEEQKKKTLEDLEVLGQQLNQVKKQEKAIVQSIFMRQGVLRYLQSLNGGNQDESGGD